MKVYIDVSNLLVANFLTGIQRVVEEVAVRMIAGEEHEIVLLSYHHNQNAFERLDNDAFCRFFLQDEGSPETMRTREKIDFEEIPPHSVFFDLDSTWNSRLKRSYLYPLLKQRGVYIVTHIYDIIPITHPQFCHQFTTMNFMAYTGAVLQYTDLVITSAKATVRALDDLAKKVGVPRKRCIVVPLGSNFSEKRTLELPDPEVVQIARGGRYILMLGTIEPRKNHALVLDALESGLAERGFHVIFAGRIGWNVEDLKKRIERHPLLDKSLFFVEKPNDATVDYLYRHAFVTAFPTFDEGFGLPIIEAFERGTPVVASDIPVLHEVAGDYADYFNPHDKKDFIRCVTRLADDREAYNERKKKLRSFVPFTWDQSARAMELAIADLSEAPTLTAGAGKPLRQMVCLTARNEDILATLPFYEHFMPFLEEIVLCTPDANVETLKNAYHGRLRLKFLTDSQILGGEQLPEDHAVRNFFLRCLAMKSDLFDDVFIMTDDDYRPLRTVRESNFLRDGAYLAYYCYDLNVWEGRYPSYTSFDVSMRKTKHFLRDHGYPTLMYSSHQPQIIDKRIFNEMTGKYPEIRSLGLCDWSTYFNYGVKHYPELFTPVPYVSLGWPGRRSDWNVYVKPDDFLFENHYDFNYVKNAPLEGLREDFHEGIEEENQTRIQRFERELRRQREDIDVYQTYCDTYRMQHREVPSFFAVYDEENLAALHMPLYAVFKSGGFTRLPFTLDPDIVKKTGARKMRLLCWFTNERGEKISGTSGRDISPELLQFLLPVVTPQFRERCVFNLHLVFEDFDRAVTAAVNCTLV